MSDDSSIGPHLDTAPRGDEATIPDTPRGPDIPSPNPDGPDPAPEVPDLPQLPDIPEAPPPGPGPDPEPVLSADTAGTGDTAYTTAGTGDTAGTPPDRDAAGSDVRPATAGAGEGDPAGAPLDTPAPTGMPTVPPSRPVTPMPTVTPRPPDPVPMPTVTPADAPATGDAPPPDQPANVETAPAPAVAEAATVTAEPAETTTIPDLPVDAAGAVADIAPTEPESAAEPAGQAQPADQAQTPTDDAKPAGQTQPAERAPHGTDSAEPAGQAQPDGPTETESDSGEPAEQARTAAHTRPETGSVAPHPQGARPSGTQKSRPGGPQGARPAGRPRSGRPGGPGGRPSPVPSPHGPHAPHGAVVEPIVEPIDPHLWGRIDSTGVVYVTTAAGERAIGNWQAGEVEAGLAHFGRKFDDFSTEIALLEARLASGTGDPKSTKAHAIALRESVDTLPAIGDLDGAAARLEIVIGAADAAIAGASQARTAARAAAIKAKEALCVEAESLAESTQWKATGDRLKAIVEEWRTIRGIDRKTDDALWKRFAKARDTFTRHRGSHFAELDKQRSAAKDAKEALIARAEALSDATEWGETAAAYRGLMEEWKAAGRAPRDVEDALWARFRAAQEKFFSRRNKTFSDRDAEFEANAAVKEKLLAEAETIDPAKGLDAAKAKMRSIQERWEAAGKVPRDRIREFDTRLRAIEDRVKSAEDRHWRRTDPETSARVEQFRSRVDTYRAQATKARVAGDERKAREAEAQAQQWEEWLRTAESAVEK